jgi:tRNA A-37 threonylcarbamoyl transferase component Bud32
LLIEHHTKQFTWFLESEDLVPVIEDLAHPENMRRGYSRCEWQGKEIFIKTFNEKGAVGRIRSLISPRGKKEYSIAAKLNSIGIPAPVPLGYGIGKQSSAIAEVFIRGTTLLELVRNNNDRVDLLRQLAKFLLLLTKKKVRHDDLHLDNILVSEHNFNLIDLHKVTVKRSFSENDEIANLKHVLSSIYNYTHPREIELFFNEYGSTPEQKIKVCRAVEALRTRWILNKMARAFRDTSIVRRQGSKLFIRGNEERCAGTFTEIIKKDRKVKVERYSDHVRKTYKHAHRLKTAWKNYVVLEYMQKHITPSPYLAALGGRDNAGYIAMEDLTGSGEELDRYLDRHYDAMSLGRRKQFIDAIAAFFFDALNGKVTHRDLKACNIFVRNDKDFLFLDVEDIRFSRATPDVLRKLFLQLNNSVPRRISSRDRMQFYLRLVSLVNIDKKKFIREIGSESVKEPIVYIGLSGTVIDHWS